MSRIPESQVDDIYDRIKSDVKLSRVHKLKASGKLPDFVAAFVKNTEEWNSKRVEAGLEPVDPKTRFDYFWDLHLREDQFQPSNDYRVWLLCAGRGWGKTYTCSVIVNKFAYDNPGCNIGVFSMTLPDIRKTMIEGVSGIIATSLPWDRPTWTPSRDNGLIEWPNGSKAHVYGTKDHEKLRGPEFDLSWCDEICFWSNPSAAWKQIRKMTRSPRFGVPKIIISTTPKTIPIMQELTTLPGFVETNGATYNNGTYDEEYLKDLIRDCYGTSEWIEEVEGRRLERISGALWDYPMIDAGRTAPLHRDNYSRIVVAVDPATETRKKASDTNTHGVIVAGLHGEDVYILEDASRDGTPMEIGQHIISVFDRWQADKIVFEKNQGGLWGPSVLTMMRSDLPIDGLYAGKRGKYLRAEPIHALYQRGLVHHTRVFEELEAQMCSFRPGDNESPDRLDAMVYAVGALKENKEKKNPFAVFSIKR